MSHEYNHRFKVKVTATRPVSFSVKKISFNGDDAGIPAYRQAGKQEARKQRFDER
jgi:hypothetical protein